LLAPRDLLTVTFGYGVSCIFYTDGSLIEGCTGFVHYIGGSILGHKILSLASVFTPEHRARFTAQQQISEVIRPPDSLNLIKAMLSRRIAH
jgi:hypothetical protein